MTSPFLIRSSLKAVSVGYSCSPSPTPCPERWTLYGPKPAAAINLLRRGVDLAEPAPDYASLNRDVLCLASDLEVVSESRIGCPHAPNAFVLRPQAINPKGDVGADHLSILDPASGPSAHAVGIRGIDAGERDDHQLEVAMRELLCGPNFKKLGDVVVSLV